MTKAQLILNKHLNGVEVGDSNKAIINAMKEFASNYHKEQLSLSGVGCSKDFKENARPLLKYLAENHHPHTTAIITSTSIELVESIKCESKIYEYIQD